MENTLTWIAQLPLWLATLFLFFVVFCRAQATFWIGKFIHKGILKTTFGQKLDQKNQVGILMLKKYGWPIISLSFLTIGLQSVIQIGAGLMDLNWYKYTLAALPGYLIWAFIYAFGGLSLFKALINGALGLWITVFIVVILVWFLGALVVKRYKVDD